MRKFAFSANAYRRFKLSQAIRHVALAGYSGIEITADAPHGYPPSLTEADRRAIRHALAQERLAISNINAAPMIALRDEFRPSWIESDSVLREERIRHTLEAGQLAKDIGGPTISTLGGGIIEEGMSRERAIGHFVAGLRHVAGMIDKGKCPPVLITPQKRLLVETAAQALEILEQVRSPKIGVAFDTGHFQRAGADLAESIRTLGAAIRHVRIEDVSADESRLTVVPGAGTVDFAAVFAALDSIGYNAWFTVDLSAADVHPDEAARQALAFLKQFDK